jgi:RNA polymerase sigma-70 factor (ECF subfamily)
MATSPKLRLVPPRKGGRALATAQEPPARAIEDEDSQAPSDDVALGELDDELLVPLAGQGQNKAAEILYRRHAAFAFNLAARIAGSTTDMEDVVHDAFLKAFDNIHNLRNTKAFRTWLGSIVVHAVRSRLRRGKFVRLFGLGRGGDPIDIDYIAATDASPRQRAELAQVYALLQTLSPDDRIAWTLRFVEGHDLKAAAELADCSLATVKRRIRRAQRYIETHYVAGTPVPPDVAASDPADSVDEQAPKSTRKARSS